MKTITIVVCNLILVLAFSSPSYAQGQSYFEIKSHGMCLDVHTDGRGSLRTNSTPVQIWSCNGQTQQKWRFDGNRLRNRAGLCLDVRRSEARTNHGYVQVWGCHNEPNQQWSYENGRLRNGHGFCLDIHRPHADARRNGGIVQIYQCHMSANQQWHFKSVHLGKLPSCHN
ncbi:ricin-type beta-trefoil lectin domain protein [Chloroflexi bacterium TSY]|nr:ricin-type beta-trefoil lectin domain protein [Chloroflexi bacterium TSY]